MVRLLAGAPVLEAHTCPRRMPWPSSSICRRKQNQPPESTREGVGVLAHAASRGAGFADRGAWGRRAALEGGGEEEEEEESLLARIQMTDAERENEAV